MKTGETDSSKWVQRVMIDSMFVNESMFTSWHHFRLTPIWLEEEDIQMLPKEVRDAHQKGETVWGPERDLFETLK